MNSSRTKVSHVKSVKYVKWHIELSKSWESETNASRSSLWAREKALPNFGHYFRVRTNFRLTFFRRTVFRLQISVWFFFSSRSFSSVHIFVRSFFRLCIFSSVHFFVCAFFRLCFFSSVHIFVCAFFRLNIFSFTHFFVCEFFRLWIFSSVHFFVCSFFRLSIFSSVYFFSSEPCSSVNLILANMTSLLLLFLIKTRPDTEESDRATIGPAVYGCQLLNAVPQYTTFTDEE